MKKQIFKTILSISLFVFSFILVNAEIEDYSYDEIPCQTYTGKNITPGLVIKKGEYVLQEGIDYTLSYKNNKKVGNATISVTGSEEYNDLILEVPFTISYKITYKLNGGTNNLLNPLFYDGKVAIKLKSPTRKGYTFNGWYSDKKFKKKVTTIKKGSKNNLTLYAKWTANKYNVKFNSNGGSGKLANLKNKVYDKSFKLPANKFKRKGYKFLGWNTKKDGTGTLYKNKASVKNLSAKNKATVTLYAQWQLIKYTIKYNLNGGINNESNPSEYYVNTPTISLKNLTKEGYKFLGWYSDKKFKKKITTIKKGSTGNKTLYAKWKQIKYQITFDGNGAKNVKTYSQTLVLDDKTILINNKYIRKGYKFIGWNTKKDGTGISYENKELARNVLSKEKITLYANWEIIHYTITYINDGIYESEEYKNITTYTVNENFAFYSPTDTGNENKKGYIFDDWYLDPDYKTSIHYLEKGRTGNLTLYGKWTTRKSPYHLELNDEGKTINMEVGETHTSYVTFGGKDLTYTTNGYQYKYGFGCLSSNTDVATCVINNNWDDYTTTMTITTTGAPGTAKITVSSTAMFVNSHKIGGFEYKKYAEKEMTVVVPNHWDELNIIAPETIIDDDGKDIIMGVNEVKISNQSLKYYTLKIDLNLIKAASSSSQSLKSTVYYYDEYGMPIGNAQFTISGLSYTSVGDNFTTTVSSIPINTKKIILGTFYDDKGDVPIVNSSNNISWNNVSLVIPNKISDDKIIGNKMILDKYDFVEVSEPTNSMKYKIRLLYRMDNYVDGSSNIYNNTINFYDSSNNLLKSSKVTINNVEKGKSYVTAINVPNNTTSIVFDNNYFITGVDASNNDPWENVELEIPNSINASSFYQGLELSNIYYSYSKTNNYVLNFDAKITDSCSYSSCLDNSKMKKEFYDKEGNKISGNTFTIEKGEVGTTVSKSIEVPVNTAKIVISN